MHRYLLLILVGLAGVLGYYFGSLNPPEPEEPTRQTIVQPTPSVVTALRDVARLEGAVVHVERVIDVAERQSRFYGLVRAEDALLLVAAGDVVAGVDLAGIEPGDVDANREAGRVSIVLPPAEILSRRLDNERTYVHTRSTDALARRQEHLETRARREAERTLAQAALEVGILERAETNVARTVEALARSLGYSQVDVRFREPVTESAPDD